MRWSLYGGAAALVLLSSAQSFAAVLLGVSAYAALTSLYKPASSTAVAELTRGPQRSQAYNLLYWAINVGASAAPVLGGWLYGFSVRLLFWLDALTMAAYGALLHFFYRSPQRAHPKERSGEQRRTWWPRDPLLWHYALAALMFATTYQSYRMLAVVFAQQGYSAAQYGQTLAINGVLVVALGLPLGHYVSRGNSVRAQAVGAALLGSGFALHAAAHSLAGHMLAVAVWTIGEIVGYSIGKSVVAELGPARTRGHYIGLVGSMSGLGLLAGPLLGGWLLERWGNAALWLSYGALAAAAALLYWHLEGAVVQRRAQHSSEEAALQT